MSWMVRTLGAIALIAIGSSVQYAVFIFISVVVMTGLVAARIIKNTPGSPNAQPVRSNQTSSARAFDTNEQHLYHRLLVMAHGDTALAERLIGYERSRTADRTRSELIDAAIERWVRDMNR